MLHDISVCRLTTNRRVVSYCEIFFPKSYCFDYIHSICNSYCRMDWCHFSHAGCFISSRSTRWLSFRKFNLLCRPPRLYWFRPWHKRYYISCEQLCSLTFFIPVPSPRALTGALFGALSLIILSLSFLMQAFTAEFLIGMVENPETASLAVFLYKGIFYKRL